MLEFIFHARVLARLLMAEEYEHDKTRQNIELLCKNCGAACYWCFSKEGQVDPALDYYTRTANKYLKCRNCLHPNTLAAAKKIACDTCGRCLTGLSR